MAGALLMSLFARHRAQIAVHHRRDVFVY